MKRRSFHEKVLYRMENGAILACVCLFTPFLGISDVTWKNIFVLAGVLALFTGVTFLSVRRKGLYLLPAPVLISVVVIAGVRTDFAYWRVYLQWCMGAGVERTEWLENFGLLHTAVLTSVAYAFQILAEKIRAVRVGVACGLMVGMLVCLFAQINLTHMSVAFTLAYIALVGAECLQDSWKKTRSGSLKEQMFWLSPFFGIYILLIALMPAPEKPYDWQWARYIYGQIRESFNVISQNIMRGGREDFGTAMSGFSDDIRLGRNVRENNREIMSIRAGSNFATNVYLIGKVYDTFDGMQWQQEYVGDEEERFIDSMETLYAVRRLDSEYVNDYLKETGISIRYESFSTGYVFAPLKTIRVAGGGMNLDYSFAGGDLLLEKRKGYGTEYDVTYYQLNMGEGYFERLLEEQTEQDESLWEKIAKEFEGGMGRRVTLGEVEAHRRVIYDNYLDQISLSKEVESYLSQIIGDAETPIEKLRAIEEEFNSYTYTTTPGGLPDSVASASEFLDYFMLESRQGYCTYFATAFALLARAEGIPARYVQGFCVPATGNKEAEVWSSMAHSWPEAYIDDVGWIPFEPTPGFERMRYTPWGVSARDSFFFYETAQGWEQGRVDEISSEAVGEEAESVEREFEEGLRLERDFRVIILGISVIFAGFVSALVLEKLISFFRYQKMDLKEKLIVEAQRNLRVLSWMGLKREENETLQELRERAVLIPELDNLLHFIEDYEEVVYGERNGTEEMLERVKEERRQLFVLIGKDKKLTCMFYRLRMFML